MTALASSSEAGCSSSTNFAMHVVQLNPRDQRTVRSRGLGLEEAIDLCLGAVDTLTGGY